MIGREHERDLLLKKANSDLSEFVVVYGRRRVGKTFLVRETFNYNFTFQHSGLAQTGMKGQLVAFQTSLIDAGYSNCPRLGNWLDAFNALKVVINRSRKKKKVIFIDEVPWMDTPKSDFVPQLEFFWNRWASSRKDILLIICGSATSWIIKKVFKNKGGLHNRVTERIPLKPFTLRECELYCSSQGIKLGREQIGSLYMTLGGVAYYWSLLRKGISAAQNIDQLFFATDAKLSGEYDELYDSLFKNPEPYKTIIQALGTRASGLTRKELIDDFKIENNGALSTMLEELEQCGFIRIYNAFDKKKRGAIYQLTDCYTLFYYKFLRGNKTQDESWWSHNLASQAIRTWSGLAFERICFAHIAQIKQKLGISGISTNVCAWRSELYKTDKDKDGAQIDLIISRADGIVNACEIKWCNGEYEITKSYNTILQNKINTFIEESKVKSPVHLTMITTNGVKNNIYQDSFQTQATLNDLFL